VDRRRFLGLSAAAALTTMVGPRIGFAAPAAIRPAFTDLTLEPRSQYSVGTIGEIALIAGGHKSNPDGTVPPGYLEAVDWVDLYDPAADVWTQAHLSEPRIEPTIASLGPVGVVVGGRRGSVGSSAVDIFDSRLRRWGSMTASEPLRHPVTTTVGRAIMIVDGPGEGASPSIQYYDIPQHALGIQEFKKNSAFDGFRGWSLTSAGEIAFLVPDFGHPYQYITSYHTDDGGYYDTKLSEPRDHPVVRVVGNRAFVVSGQGTGVTTMDVIDLDNGHVTTMPLPRPDARLVDVTGDQGSRLLFQAPAPGEPRDIDGSQFDLFDADSNSWASLFLTHPRLGVQVATHLGWYFFIGGSVAAGDPIAGRLDIYRTKTGEMSGGQLHDPCVNYSIGMAGKRVVITGGMEQRPGQAPRPSKNGDIIEVDGGGWSGGLSVARENALVTTAGLKALFVGGDTHPEGGVHEPQAPIVDIFDSTAW
jgi:hypothetical protein